jgi:hypothetical protein
MAEQARRTSGGSLHTTFVAVAWLAVLCCASAIIAWPNRQIHMGAAASEICLAMGVSQATAAA